MGAIPSSLRYRALRCPSRNVADAGEAVDAFSSRTVSKGPTSLPGARSPETRSKFRRCGPSWRRSLTNRSMRTEMWSYRISRFQGRKVTGKFARFAATDVSATRSPLGFVKSFVALRRQCYFLNYYCIMLFHIYFIYLSIRRVNGVRIIRMIDIEEIRNYYFECTVHRSSVSLKIIGFVLDFLRPSMSRVDMSANRIFLCK